MNRTDGPSGVSNNNAAENGETDGSSEVEAFSADDSGKRSEYDQMDPEDMAFRLVLCFGIAGIFLILFLALCRLGNQESKDKKGKSKR